MKSIEIANNGGRTKHDDLSRRQGMEAPPLAAGAQQLALSSWLDMSRWLAAYFVLVTHINIRMLAPYLELPASAHTLPMLVYTFICGFAHYAVMVFFVLSGYLVGGPVLQRVGRVGRYGWNDFKEYAVKRIARLCVVLWPALLLTWLLVAIAYTLDPAIFTRDIRQALMPAVLACNAAFLQDAACPQFGENGALWSLYNEFWYYMAWPLLAVGVFGNAMSAWSRLICLLCFGVIFFVLTYYQFTGSAWGPYMGIWLLGVGASAIRRPMIRRSWISACLLGGVLLLIRLFVRRSYNDIASVTFVLDCVVSLAFANLLLSLRHDQRLPVAPRRRLQGFLASFSYSLYVVHEPLLMFYIAWLFHFTGTGWRMTSSHAFVWLELLVAALVCIFVAFAFSLLTERHTDTVRRFLKRTLWPTATGTVIER